jgi:tetratricopeptide (TPR) repeat protein
MLLSVAGAGVLVTRADELAGRVRNLIAGGRYDLAREILDDWTARGESLDADERWLRAELETDPDEFDRRLHELLREVKPADPRYAEWSTARAIEHFAQGRYQTAADLLSARSETSLLADPQAALFLGMAQQALGQVNEAEATYARIPSDHPAHAAALALRADLAARSGRWRAASDLARKVVDDPDYGAQARLILAQAARVEGQDAEARDWLTRLRRDFPQAVESSWGQATPTPTERELPTGFREVDAPDPRRDYALQLGAFQDRSLALRFVQELLATPGLGLEKLRVEVDRTESPPWYRVVAGNYITRSQAQRAADELTQKNRPTLILGPERAPR